jgi:hypothetical protein
MAITRQTLYRHVAPDRTLREDAHTSFYSALFWANGVGADFKRIECSTRISGTIIVLYMRQSLSPADTKNRKGPRVSTICRSSLLGSAWRKKPLASYLVDFTF